MAYATKMADKEDRAQAVANWYDRWHELVVRVLSSRLRNKDDVQELSQEVYLRLLRVKKPDLIKQPQPYLYRVAVNVAEEWRLRAQQALDHGPEGLEDLAAYDDPAHETETTERDQAVQEALSALPLACRTAVVLHVRDGLTYDEIAASLGVSHRVVKRNVARGYSVLRERLSLVLRLPRK